MWCCFHRWCASQAAPGVRFPRHMDTYLRLCIVHILLTYVCSFSLIVSLFSGSCSFSTNCLAHPSREKAKQALDVVLPSAYMWVVNLSGDAIAGYSLSSLPFTEKLSSQGGMVLFLQTVQGFFVCVRACACVCERGCIESVDIFAIRIVNPPKNLNSPL